MEIKKADLKDLLDKTLESKPNSKDDSVLDYISAFQVTAYDFIRDSDLWKHDLPTIGKEKFNQLVEDFTIPMFYFFKSLGTLPLEVKKDEKTIEYPRVNVLDNVLSMINALNTNIKPEERLQGAKELVYYITTNCEAGAQDKTKIFDTVDIFSLLLETLLLIAPVDYTFEYLSAEYLLTNEIK